MAGRCSTTPHPLVSLNAPAALQEQQEQQQQQQQPLCYYPASGVLPWAGMARLVLPLLKLHQQPEQVYRTFRELYCRHWCRLVAPDQASGAQPALPALCRMVIDLLLVSRCCGAAPSDTDQPASACVATGPCRPMAIDLGLPVSSTASAMHRVLASCSCRWLQWWCQSCWPSSCMVLPQLLLLIHASLPSRSCWP